MYRHGFRAAWLTGIGKPMRWACPLSLPTATAQLMALTLGPGSISEENNIEFLRAAISSYACIGTSLQSLFSA